LTGPGATGSETLATVKRLLATGLPSVFGFPVPSSLSTDADIAYRPTYDAVRGGQAVVAVGYDDGRRNASRGALLIRSSWGSAVGEEGCFWLPYDYVRAELATDFWTLLGSTWLRRGDFATVRATV
jgi:C1A family cysteine protease